VSSIGVCTMRNRWGMRKDFSPYTQERAEAGGIRGVSGASSAAGEALSCDKGAREVLAIPRSALAQRKRSSYSRKDATLEMGNYWCRRATRTPTRCRGERSDYVHLERQVRGFGS
jgi:hypothetical protein